MRLWATIEEIPHDLRSCVLTIGVFDGVHRGHAQLIRRTVAEARTRDVPAVLMTFEPHPAAVVFRTPPPARLTTSAHKIDLVAELGIDAFLVVAFSAAFAATPAEQFVQDELVERLHVASVVVGANFTYGYRGSGTVATLAEAGQRYGFAVDAMPLAGVGGAVVSATTIRNLIGAGDVVQAAQLLGRPFRCDGVIVRGEQRGRALGYPTANVDMAADSAVPADGVYAGRVVGLDGSGRATGEVLGNTAISVGSNPTFDGRHRTVEAFILDFDDDLYGRRLGVEFSHRLRGMVKFDSVEALIKQMDADVLRTRELMTTPSI